VLGRSEFSVQWPRSVVLNKELEAGDYVLHVSHHSSHIQVTGTHRPILGAIGS
jgi:hypothetical protein